MTQALSIQHGGTHYKTMALQPVEFCFVNRYDPPAFSALKYVSRHASKGGREDLLKGRHFIQLRRDLRRDHPELYHANALDVIPISEFITVNKMPRLEASILTDLHEWAIGKHSLTDFTVADFLIQKFDILIDYTYDRKKD